jgi:hypothetical protein
MERASEASWPSACAGRRELAAMTTELQARLALPFRSAGEDIHRGQACSGGDPRGFEPLAG